jgi:hypothetical protein
MTRPIVHKRKAQHVLGESVGGVFGALCDGYSYRRRLHELWSEVTCPKCLAQCPEKPCPNCGQRHGNRGCIDSSSP